MEVHRPVMGGFVWMGEDEAWQATRELLEIADGQGRLRALIDAIQSHRVEEDFSDRWSYAREDFERKLYAKRVRHVKVTFVQLDDTVPVHGREAEVHESLCGRTTAFRIRNSGADARFPSESRQLVG